MIHSYHKVCKYLDFILFLIHNDKILIYLLDDLIIKKKYSCVSGITESYFCKINDCGKNTYFRLKCNRTVF